MAMAYEALKKDKDGVKEVADGESVEPKIAEVVELPAATPEPVV
jgi:hypothetical protein